MIKLIMKKTLDKNRLQRIANAAINEEPMNVLASRPPGWKFNKENSYMKILIKILLDIFLTVALAYAGTAIIGYAISIVIKNSVLLPDLIRILLVCLTPAALILLPLILIRPDWFSAMPLIALMILPSCVSTSVNRIGRHERLIEVCDHTDAGLHYVYHHAKRQVELNKCDRVKYLRLDKECAVLICIEMP